MDTRDIMYIIFGYLMGSLLFARLFARLFYKRDVTDDSDDQNPGTANAFKYGGFWMGTLTLIGDLLKGFIPVYFYVRGSDLSELGFPLSLVIAAPVVGHVFPVFYKFKGGKGIASSFGTLLGLTPEILPAMILAVTFIVLSVVVKISPHYYRTLVAYGVSSIAIVLLGCIFAVAVGFMINAVMVTLKLLMSREQKEALEVKLVWKH